MTNLSLNLDETAWQYACDKSNAGAKTAFDRGEAAKRAKDAGYLIQAFVPETWEAYAQRIISGLESNYTARQKAEVTKAHLEVISAQDPNSIALMAAVSALPVDDPRRVAMTQQAATLPPAPVTE